MTATQQKLWDEQIKGNPFLTMRSAVKAFQYVEMTARYLAAPNAFSAAMIAQLDRLSADLYVDDAAVYREQRSETKAAGGHKPTANRFLSRGQAKE